MSTESMLPLSDLESTAELVAAAYGSDGEQPRVRRLPPISNTSSMFRCKSRPFWAAPRWAWATCCA